MTKNLDKIFQELKQRYLAVMERQYMKLLKKANDKAYVFEEINKGLQFALEIISSDENKTFVEIFENNNKWGISISETLDHLRRNYADIDDLIGVAVLENGKEEPFYIDEEQKKLKSLASDERKLIKFFVRYQANKEFRERLPVIYDSLSRPASNTEYANTTTVNYDIQWSGKSANEFVQLVYGFHKAGLINKGQGEVTKVVEALAQVFGVKLSKNWQANHSNSIHRQNKDYEPTIFKTIQDAYKEYFTHQIMKKSKR